VLRAFMESYSGVRGEQSLAAQDLLALAKTTQSRSGGRRWTRDELHERE